ncbi:iron reductase domain protein, partial [Parathielavia appendiculata]
SYIDVETGITFYGLGSPASPTGYSFGMLLPQSPTTDFIAQIISPLTDGDGWGGVSLGSSMVGPLLLVTWANGDKVMSTARIANGHTPDAVVPYTANPIIILPIARGTFVNRTHVSSTFLCSGCINSDSFDPARADGWGSSNHSDVFFGYAFSQTAVDHPSDINTALSDHTGTGSGYGSFRVELSDIKSDEFEHYAAMA